MVFDSLNSTVIGVEFMCLHYSFPLYPHVILLYNDYHLTSFLCHIISKYHLLVFTPQIKRDTSLYLNK